MLRDAFTRYDTRQSRARDSCTQSCSIFTAMNVPLTPEFIKVLLAASKKQKNNSSARARRRAMERALNKYYGNAYSKEGQEDGAS